MGQDRSTYRDKRKHVRSFKKQIDTDAWRALSGSAVKVMLAMGLFENGDNNGEWFFSDRTGAEMTGLSRNTVRRAIAELIEMGFLYCSERGGFSRKTPHAAKYGFTWLAGPSGPNRAPSHAYEKWKHENSRDQFLTRAGAVSDIGLETSHPTGAELEPDGMEKPVISADAHFSDIEPQTVSQGDRLAGLETEQRKQANSCTRAELDALRQSTLDHLGRHDPGEQSRLADSLGIPHGTLSKFIHGRNLPERYRDALSDAVMVF
ncbi:helix-turn-helix domain-containing protein [Croceicoccus naphthovorans]|uniref:Uncharacterized protein n=1 Tax=Croceicoccus naphthovorans TaxID=1348774 RepID=A0A0G3XGH8_9SPHN|nr:helix-turn-helix domain-containing protein [Croceicoccus naphthovorans]AKM09714.1 hypothetical protein AB433_06540 [Croceicoccus naphthovorans]MBB3990854.1 hypothetical protein [Croceicoccus naphthovorans]